MTRETKIGMLVGLAFIIVIGILLSDHMTSTTEPRQADQARAGTDVRGGTTTPAANVPTTTAVIPPPSIATAPLPTQQELTAAARQSQLPAAVQSIQVGPGGAAVPQQQILIQPGNAPAPTSVVIGPGTTQQPVTQQPIVITQPPTGPLADAGTPDERLNNWAGNGGGAPQPGPIVVQPPQPVRPTGGVPMAAVKQYKAEAGDNLHKMALKTMGVSTKETREAILNANPALKANPDKIIVGRTYVIPPTTGAPVVVAPQPTPSTPVAQHTPPAVAPSRPGGPIEVSTAEELNAAMQRVLGGNTNAGNTPVPADNATADGYRWYTVQENDTLWGIAAENLGAGSKLTVIQELNKELLKDKVTVHPGQKLRLPTKQVASAGN